MAPPSATALAPGSRGVARRGSGCDRDASGRAHGGVMDTMTYTTPSATTTRRLPAELLEGFRARAPRLDRDNTYFTDDLDELRAHGYLAAAVPSELGGWGLGLDELAASQRRLARYAPATALALSMHSYWVGIATELERLGDT